MRRVRRAWLRRIPGYGEEERPVFRRRPGEGVPDPEGEPGEDDSPEGEAGEASVEAEGDPMQNGEGQPGEGEDSDGEPHPGDEGKPADGEEPRLSIPDEVEEARRNKEEQRRLGAENPNLAPQAFSLEGRYLRGLSAQFARMVSKVAEDSADLPSEGDEEWDLVELQQRRFTGRLISQCRMTREKRKVAVVLDTSPSCEHQARLFGTIARVAEELGDCELYDAPNFAIYARKIKETWEQLPEPEREWNFQRRVVLAFGDFDGIDRISRASAIRGNRIYWFCCEERPTVLEHNRDFFVKNYKGKYFPATELDGLMKAMRKVR